MLAVISKPLKAGLFLLPADHTLKFIEGELGRFFNYRRETLSNDHLGVLDTFDWRLYNNSLGLYHYRGYLQLINLTSGKTVGKVDCTQPPRFVADLAESEIKRRLSQIVQQRALLLRAEVDRQLFLLGVFNSNRKTVARLMYEEFTNELLGEKNPLAVNLWILEMQGYSKQYNKLQTFFEERGYPEILEKDRFLRFFQSFEEKPGDYSSRIELNLDPGMQSIEAVQEILRSLLLQMRKNETGIIADIDIEFLHDHRVAVRRTRSALTQLKDILPHEKTSSFIRDFKRIAEITNELRDMDVYLSRETEYSSNVPPALVEELIPLFNYLRERRAKALHHVVQFIDSEGYQQFLKEWEIFINDPFSGWNPPETATSPVTSLAEKSVWKQYKRVLKNGEKTMVNKDEEMLHVLRIDCKKLRYLLEFFSSLFPPRTLASILGNMRQLQDILGDYHDYFVQQAHLLSFSDELQLDKGQEPKTLLAVGSLINSLESEKIGTLAEFEGAFAAFSSRKNRRLFKEAINSLGIEEAHQ